MADLPERLLHEGISIDIVFDKTKPMFGDLFLICGITHPKFPPSGTFGFDSLSELQFEQADDYFGVKSLSDEGDDVPIWLYPLVNGEPVHHHPGPFDGIRLDYNILRNPVRRAEHYLDCVSSLAELGNSTIYRSREMALGSPPDMMLVVSDIDAVVEHWKSEGIEVGSSEALVLDY